MRIQDLQLPEERGVERIDKLLPEGSYGRRARFRRKNGSILWVNRVDQPLQFQGIEARLLVARDITDRLKAQRRLAYLAEHDALTSLPNRLLLDERMQETLAESERSAKKAALLSIDIDHFKRINDTHGHLAGDACLKAVAERLKAGVRQFDTLARTGGEEFTAILGGLDSAFDAELIAAGLLRISEEPLRLPDLELSVTVSIGVALFPDDARDGETLRSISDEALYFAKRSGRNRVVFASALK
jgi:diguanylate cyclase (GGDEF)-like protein